ncbi:MAG: hypothetical protein HYY16_07500 [Planctomycetes bacterium]|nr:hypothetical protein [Planctomycetota bacterium]
MGYAATLLVILAAQQDPALSWKYRKGETLRWELSQLMAIGPEGGMSEQNLRFVLRQVVQAVDDRGGATLETTFEAVSFTIAGVGDAEFDSTKDDPPPGDPLGRSLAGLRGQRFSMKIDATGEISEVKGFEDIARKMIEPLDESSEMARTWIRQLYSDEVQRAMLQQAFVQLPPKAVTVGNDWKTTLRVDLPTIGSMVLDFTGAVQSIRENTSAREAVIDQYVTISQGDGEPGLIEIGEGKGSRHIVFQIDRGQAVLSRMELELRLKLADGEIPFTLITEMKPAPAGEDRK